MCCVRRWHAQLGHDPAGRRLHSGGLCVTTESMARAKILDEAAKPQGQPGGRCSFTWSTSTSYEILVGVQGRVTVSTRKAYSVTWREPSARAGGRGTTPEPISDMLFIHQTQKDVYGIIFTASSRVRLDRCQSSWRSPFDTLRLLPLVMTFCKCVRGAKREAPSRTESQTKRRATSS